MSKRPQQDLEDQSLGELLTSDAESRWKFHLRPKRPKLDINSKAILLGGRGEDHDGTFGPGDFDPGCDIPIYIKSQALTEKSVNMCLIPPPASINTSKSPPLQSLSIPSNQVPCSGPNLLELSDELLICIFTNLSIDSVIVCQRVCRRFSAVANDRQVWRALFNRSFGPRRGSSRSIARRDGGVSRTAVTRKLASSVGPRGLRHVLNPPQSERHIVKAGVGLKSEDWLNRYRLRHNWSLGSANVKELSVHHRVSESLSPHPQNSHQESCHNSSEDGEDGNSGPLFQFHNGHLLSIDQISMCVWETSSGSLKTRLSLQYTSAPTAFKIDGHRGSLVHIATVGFSDGSFAILRLTPSFSSLHTLYQHPASSNGSIMAIASREPYIMTVSESKIVSVYQFEHMNVNKTSVLASDQQLDSNVWSAPSLIHSLSSFTLSFPLAIRLTATGNDSSNRVTASIAYHFHPLCSTTTSVGIQELIFESDCEGNVHSRVAIAEVPSGDRPTLSPPSASRKSHALTVSSSRSPTSLSYSHPYLLTSNVDNTLSVYLVTSNPSTLRISQPSRLWGHTSAVVAAMVSDRGRAVSLARIPSSSGLSVEQSLSSTSGTCSKYQLPDPIVVPNSFAGLGEVRIWELEGMLSTKHSRARQSILVGNKEQNSNDRFRLDDPDLFGGSTMTEGSIRQNNLSSLADILLTHSPKPQAQAQPCDHTLIIDSVSSGNCRELSYVGRGNILSANNDPSAIDRNLHPLANTTSWLSFDDTQVVAVSIPPSHLGGERGQIYDFR